MKSLRYIIFIILIAAFFSCEDFLDKQPTDQLSVATFWQNEQEAEMALAGVYKKMQIEVIASRIGHWDGLSDNAYCKNPWESNFTNIGKGELSSTLGGVLTDVYYGCYKGIAVCNTFLAHVDNIEGADQALMSQYKAEVKFIRAFHYYWLTQCFGDVPLVTDVLPIEEMNIPRSSKDDVLNFMYDDLNFAIANLPDEVYSGHIVKGAALALKARVKMFNNEFPDAAIIAKQIIDGALFTLAKDYRANFLEDFNQDNCPEIIFSIKYLGPDNPNLCDRAYGWFQGANPLPGYVKSHEEGDMRLEWNVMQKGDYWLIADSYGYNPIFDAAWNRTDYGIRKWVNPSTDNTNLTIRGNDVTHLRFAEVLLVYAESKNETSGPDISVYEAINKIRQRAGLGDLPAGLSQEEMRQQIRHERRVELAFEAQRYFDLKRWGIAKDIIPTLYDPPNQTVTKRIWRDHFMLWPIPQDEIDRDPDNMIQNPGYNN